MRRFFELFAEFERTNSLAVHLTVQTGEDQVKEKAPSKRCEMSTATSNHRTTPNCTRPSKSPDQSDLAPRRTCANPVSLELRRLSQAQPRAARLPAPVFLHRFHYAQSCDTLTFRAVGPLWDKGWNYLHCLRTNSSSSFRRRQMLRLKRCSLGVRQQHNDLCTVSAPA